MTEINSSKFYNEYHGHRLNDLELLYKHLRNNNKNKNNNLIFLAGDSSLDNKHWFHEQTNAINDYETILNPPVSRQDIAYWMNYSLVHETNNNNDDDNNTNNTNNNQKNLKWKVINCAIEESTVGARSCGRLLPQDKFIRDNIQSDDILVISVGGNDIALHPSLCTILNLISLTYCSTESCLSNSCGTSLPCDDCFCGCVCSTLSNCFAFPCGLGYFIHLFKTRIQTVLQNMTSKTRPKYIFVCMIYYLDETRGNSWAEYALSALQYNQNPKKLQLVISTLFELATKQIQIPGTTVIGIPLFQVLNGKDSNDYVERVEPSAIGGKKMGSFIISEIMKKISINNHQKEGGFEDVNIDESVGMIR